MLENVLFSGSVTFKVQINMPSRTVVRIFGSSLSLHATISMGMGTKINRIIFQHEHAFSVHKSTIISILGAFAFQAHCELTSLDARMVLSLTDLWTVMEPCSAVSAW